MIWGEMSPQIVAGDDLGQDCTIIRGDDLGCRDSTPQIVARPKSSPANILWLEGGWVWVRGCGRFMKLFYCTPSYMWIRSFTWSVCLFLCIHISGVCRPSEILYVGYKWPCDSTLFTQARFLTPGDIFVVHIYWTALKTRPSFFIFYSFIFSIRCLDAVFMKREYIRH